MSSSGFDRRSSHKAMAGNAAHAGPKLEHGAGERLQAGCAKALLGKAALPDDLPWPARRARDLQLGRQ
ncbi:MAG TPA: hypothetical protein VGV37_03190 [Aliidongia sp.]|uniref:hypothetical protein n=1 Tax=Aliidongia sp. TaxID=1914230 RepID=UPI002DDDA9D2|nr:hypothetical protein [Aliidongia sp.]HEV2673519.1 hypothetical protein [Aliidongia sp.]